MDATFARIDSWIIALLLALAMFGGWVLGWYIRRKERPEPEDKSASRFVDASFGLLGLLLGFSFAMAVTKHEARRQVFLADTNSIGDFYTCVSFLPGPPRAELQESIREYVNIRLTLMRSRPDPATIEKGVRDSEALQQRMTSLAIDAVHANTYLAVPLTTTLNNLTSSQASLISAMRDRLPLEVFFLLASAAVVSTLLVGRHYGARSHVHFVGVCSYVLLVALAVCVILDLNQPDRGLIRVSTEPLERLAASIAK